MQKVFLRFSDNGKKIRFHIHPEEDLFHINFKKKYLNGFKKKKIFLSNEKEIV